MKHKLYTLTYHLTCSDARRPDSGESEEEEEPSSSISDNLR